MQTEAQKSQTMTLRNLLVNTDIDSPLLDREITGLSIDSRSLQPGDCFFAYPGTKQDGRDNIEQAIASGASAVICELGGDYMVLKSHAEVPIIPITEVIKKVGEFAARFYGYPSRFLDVVGITGTNGKTTCTQFLAAAMHNADYPSGVFGTLGSGLYGQLTPGLQTTENPIVLQKTLASMVAKRVKAVAMEVSSHALDQGRINGIEFDIAVFTNLTRDHLDYHKNMKSYADSKRAFFQMDDLRYAVINADDSFGQELIGSLRKRLPVYAFSARGQQVNGVPMVLAEQVQVTSTGFSAVIKSPWGEGRLSSELLGRFNLSNQLAVLTCLGLLGMTLPEALTRLASVLRVPGRMEPFGGVNDQPLVVVDYAHTPDALEQAMQALREHCRGQLWCVFGCGGDRDHGKRTEMAEVAERFSDHIVITDDNVRSEDPELIAMEILKGLTLGADAFVEHDRAAAIDYAVRAAAADDIVLVAGKGHEMYQIIGAEKQPFSDREQVQLALSMRG